MKLRTSVLKEICFRLLRQSENIIFIIDYVDCGIPDFMSNIYNPSPGVIYDPSIGLLGIYISSNNTILINNNSQCVYFFSNFAQIIIKSVFLNVMLVYIFYF